MDQELIIIIKRFYKYQDQKKILQTNNAINEIGRFIRRNGNDHLCDVLKNEVQKCGSLKFMVKLEHEGIVRKAAGYCSCNGGTWVKKGE
jgi:hypothetical protein